MYLHLGAPMSPPVSLRGGVSDSNGEEARGCGGCVARGFGLRAGPPSGACRVRGSLVVGTICANETANHGSLPSECALVSGGPALRRQSRGGSSAWEPERARSARLRLSTPRELLSPTAPSGEGVLRDLACATNESSDTLFCADSVGVLFWGGRVFGGTRFPEGDGSVSRKEPT